jgi:hypothetical protein
MSLASSKGDDPKTFLRRKNVSAMRESVRVLHERGGQLVEKGKTFTIFQRKPRIGDTASSIPGVDVE